MVYQKGVGYRIPDAYLEANTKPHRLYRWYVISKITNPKLIEIFQIRSTNYNTRIIDHRPVRLPSNAFFITNPTDIRSGIRKYQYIGL